MNILNLPSIDKTTCENILVKPVKEQQTINWNKIIKCNDKIYEAKGNCNQFIDLSFCNRNELVDISETNCISPLLNSKRYDSNK